LVRFRRAGVIVLLVAALDGSAEAQEPRPGRPGSLQISVRDSTDLPVADAQVTVTAPDGFLLKTATNQRGQAVLENLPPGTYSATVAREGFELLELSNLAVRSGGRTTRDIVLRIAAVLEQVDVAPDAPDSQLLDAFTSELSPDQLASLPDDPEELALVLQALAGADDAEIRVDGLTGGRLPPGTQIQDVRIRYDAAADSASGGPRIEIRTRPGGDRWRNNANASVRSSSLNARNAFSGQRPSDETRQYAWTLAGPIVRNRTGLSLSIDSSETFEEQAIRAAAPGGLFSTLIQQPTSRLGFNARVDHVVNAAHTIRLQVSQSGTDARNQGIGEFDLPERAFLREQSTRELRFSHDGTFRRRFVNQLRFQVNRRSTESSSTSDATTVRVLDAFTAGGAQIQGGRRSQTFELEDEIEFTVRRQHQITAGVTFNISHYSSDEQRNANGTFTFASLAMLEAGLPTTFTQRVGSPVLRYGMHRLGLHFQDNYRVRRNLMVNLGLRYDRQSHVGDSFNFSPRVGINWTPVQGGRTTWRASIGVSQRFLNEGLYEQALLVDGLQQRDLVIANPGYPDPFDSGVAQAQRAPSIIRLRSDLVLPSTRQFSVGIDHRLAAWMRLRATWSRQVGRNLFRSLDVNAPIDGVRPDPSVRNITEVGSTARSLNESLDLNVSLTHQPRRFSATVGYTLGGAWNETDGAQTLPPDSADTSGEWGPSRQDIRHRLRGSINTDLWAGFRLTAGFNAQSAAPYTITTGQDVNGDGVNNERPAGVGRNSARGAATKNVDMTLTWGRGFGRRQTVDAPRGGGQPGRSGANARGGVQNELVRFEVFTRASNVLNLVNAQSFSGVLTSPFFGRPTSAQAARRIVIGTRVSF
jgi:hypothetical protein